MNVQPPTTGLDREVWDPSRQPAVKVKDAAGAAVANAVVTASIGSGSGTLQGALTATTNASGVAKFADLGIAGTGAHRLRYTAGGASALSGTVTLSALPATATSGRWDPPADWDIVPLHLSLLPTGKLIAWGKYEAGTTSMGNPRLWDPAAGPPSSAISLPTPDMLFCSGHALMADGRLMVSGGHFADDRGLKATNIFDPVSQTWTTGLPKMAQGRWYPTVTTLADGRMVTVAGRDSASNVVLVPEIWEAGKWVRLPGASLRLPYYPYNFLAPNGKVFYAGERTQARWLDVDATGANGRGKWTTATALKHLWPFNRDYGSAVMYETGKVLIVGGGGDPNRSTTDARSNLPTATAETIDLNVTGPKWTGTDPMRFARRHLNATILPDGQVLATGGTSASGFNTLSGAVHAAEVWNPATGRWTQLASNAVDRVYHSVSLLLPDGTVLHGASGDAIGSQWPALSGAAEPRDLPAAVSVQGDAADDHRSLEDHGRLRGDVHGDHAVRRPDHRRALDPARLGHPRVRREPAGQHPHIHPRIGAGAGDRAVQREAGAAGPLPAVPAQPERGAVRRASGQGAVGPAGRCARPPGRRPRRLMGFSTSSAASTMRLTLLESDRSFLRSAEIATLSIAGHLVLLGLILTTPTGTFRLPASEREAMAMFLLPPDRQGATERQAEVRLPGKPGSGLDEAGELPADGQGMRLAGNTRQVRHEGERSGAKGEEPFGPAEFLMEKAYTALQVDQMVERYESSAAPVYPPELSARGTEGAVEAEYVVDAEGRVDTTSIRVMRSDHPRFTESVREALAEARFRPAKRAGKSVRQLVLQRFRFKRALGVP